MASSVPLNNALAQNSVDFNNQTPTNAAGLFRYKINNYGGTHTFTTADVNAVCIFTGDAVVTLNNSNFNDLVVGSEIIFYSTGGYVKIVPNSTSLYYTLGPFTDGANRISKIVYAGNNSWFFAGINYSVNGYGWENCCIESETVYQLSTTITSARKFYADVGLTIPYNGTIINNDFEAGFSFEVVNGVSVGTGACSPNDYSYNYTFFTGPDEESDSLTLYSVSGLDPYTPSSLLGNKFFTVPLASEYSCFETNVYSGTVYAAPANYPGSPIVISGGYVISY